MDFTTRYWNFLKVYSLSSHLYRKLFFISLSLHESYRLISHCCFTVIHCVTWKNCLTSLSPILLIFSSHWFSIEGDFVSQGTSINCTDMFYFYKQEKGATGIKWTETRGAIKYNTIHRTAPHYKELSILKCQLCWGWRTLHYGDHKPIDSCHFDS